MSSFPWIKVYSDILQSRKMRAISRSTRFTYIELIVLAGQCDCGGALLDDEGPLDNSYIAWRLDMSVDELKNDLDALLAAGLISIDSDVNALYINNFAERQGRPHSERLEQYRASQQKHRATQRSDNQQCQQPVNVDNQLTQHDVFSLEGDKDKEEEGKIVDKKSKKESRASTRPRDLLFDAVAEVTLSNPKLLGSRIAKCANQLRDINATPEQVMQVAEWYAQNDWRGKNGDKLTFSRLAEVWEQGIKNIQIATKSVQNNAPPQVWNYDMPVREEES